MQPSGCWNSPTDQSHETRRTHARKKLVARGTYRALLFFVYSLISRYKITRPSAYKYAQTTDLLAPCLNRPVLRNLF
jgi:hypothetical protein